MKSIRSQREMDLKKFSAKPEDSGKSPKANFSLFFGLDESGGIKIMGVHPKHMGSGK